MSAPVGGVQGWALRSLREVLTEIERRAENPAVSDTDLRRWLLSDVVPRAKATQDRWRRLA